MKGLQLRKLEIVVPVFNQANAIRAQGPFLESVLQLAPTNLRISVSDNASTDDTQVAVLESMPSAAYFRQKINVGVERNIEHLIQGCQSEFIWVLGAGDVPSGDLMSLLNTLKGADKNIAIFLDENCAYDGFSPYIGGAIWRTTELQKVIRQNASLGDSGIDDMWPQVSWSYQLQSQGLTVRKIPAMGAEIYKDSSDWHAKHRMYPFAVNLMNTMHKFQENAPNLVSHHDIITVRQTLATWYSQDLITCKVENKWGDISDLFSRISPLALTIKQALVLVTAQLTPRWLLRIRMSNK